MGDWGAFVRNRWYVAAWGSEVSRELLQRWILGQPVLLYRTEDGRAVALNDRCPHRRYPLSKGCLVGDAVQCGYHGFVFDSDGACLRVPGQSNVPSRAAVRSYPIVERWKWLWIWMGDPDRADESLIPDHDGWLKVADPDWRSIVGHRLHVNGRYQLLNENLLDLSHLSFVHPGSIGTGDVAEAPITTDVDERSVRVTRDMRDAECPPFFEKVMGLEGRIDRRQTAEFFPPSYHVTHLRAAPVGGSEDVANYHRAIHMATPETETTTHYFWALSRTYALEDDWVDEAMRDSIRDVFQQDIDALEAQEAMIASDDECVEISVKLDAGGLHSRRLLRQLLEEE